MPLLHQWTPDNDNIVGYYNMQPLIWKASQNAKRYDTIRYIYVRSNADAMASLI